MRIGREGGEREGRERERREEEREGIRGGGREREKGGEEGGKSCVIDTLVDWVVNNNLRYN